MDGLEAKCHGILVVGMGRMGRRHVQELQGSDRWELLGTVDRRGQRVPDIPAFASLEEALVRTGATSIVVATPDDSHEEIALRGLELGLHVLLEKPLCPDSRAARALERRFQEKGLVLFPGHCEVFQPAFVALLAALSTVGRVRAIEAIRQGAWPERERPSGLAYDLSIHDLDLVLRIRATLGFGAEPGRIVEVVPTRGPGRLAMRGDFAWSQGPTARVVSGWGVEGPERRLSITGDRGVLVADFVASTLVRRDGREDCPLPVPGGRTLPAEHRAFAERVAGGKPDGRDLEIPLLALELAETLEKRLGEAA